MALFLNGVAWAQPCMPDCAVFSTVVHAAGVPSEMSAQLRRLSFDGRGLAAADAVVVQALAAQWKTLPPKAVATITTSADGGLTGAAARAQAEARAAALHRALVQAGVAARQLKVVAAR